MFDHDASQRAFRARLVTLSVASTGSVSLSATSNGYERAAGSFIADGFVAGMEVSASGFSTAINNGPHIVNGVSTSVLTISGGLATESAAVGRIVTAGVPSRRAYENLEFTPVTGWPYLEEEYTPGPVTLKSFPYSGGDAEVTGLYTVRWYGVERVGPAALAKSCDAVLELFKPGTILTLPSGQVVRVRGDAGPSRTSVRADSPGWAVCTITIPWRARYTN